MRKNVIWAVAVIGAALLQTTWLDFIRVRGVLPDLVVLLVVYFALTEGAERAMFTGVLGGLFQDVASNATLGHHVLCLVLVGYGAGQVNARLVTDHPAAKAGLVFLASLVAGLLYLGILYVQKPETRALNALTARVIPTAFYTAVATPLVFWPLDRLLRRYRSSLGGAA